MSDMDPLYQLMKSSAQDMSEASVVQKTMITADDNTDVNIPGYGDKPSYSKQLRLLVGENVAYIVPDEPTGLEKTTDGQYFKVPLGPNYGDAYQLFRNENGVAVPQSSDIPFIYDNPIETAKFLEWVDKNGLEIARWIVENGKTLGLVSPGLTFTTDTIITGLFAMYKLTTSDVGMSLSDKNGLVYASWVNSVLSLPPFTLDCFDVKVQSKLITVVSNLISLTVDAFNVSASNFTLSTQGDMLVVTDKNGLVCFAIRANGNVESTGGGSGGGGDFSPSEKYIIDTLEGRAGAYAGRRKNLVNFPCTKNRIKLSFWIVYGQSFSVGAQSSVAISTTQSLGNVMLGGSPRGSNFSNTLTDYTYGPVGGANVLMPLVEVTQSGDGSISGPATNGYGETIAWAFANELKSRHNDRLRVDNDPNLIIGVACCGVAGKSIEQLSKGASPELYNRYITALAGIAEAAAAEGYDWEIGGIIFMQGENNNSSTTGSYLPKLQTLYNDMIADAKAASGQTTTPIFILNQYGNGYMSGQNYGVPEAQRQFAETNPLVILMGTYAGQPNPGAHLYANSYRLIGAQMAKEADRMIWNQDESNMQMVGAYVKGRDVYIGIASRVPPLTFKTAYKGNVATLYDDKGITLKDSTGDLFGANIAVSVVSDNVIKVTANRDFTGYVRVLIGDGTNHSGIHNIADSDTEISNLLWETGLPSQPSGENIATLAGKPYALYNFAILQSINAETLQ